MHATSRNQSQSVALRVHSACNQCNQGASSLTCQGVTHARVEEAGLLRTCGEAGRGAVVSTRMRALKRRVCCAPPTSVYRSRRISGSVSSTTRASYLHAISRNQSQSVAIRDASRGGRSHPREWGVLRRSELPRGASWAIKGDRTWEIAPSRVQGVLRRSELPRGALR